MWNKYTMEEARARYTRGTDWRAYDIELAGAKPKGDGIHGIAAPPRWDNATAAYWLWEPVADKTKLSVEDEIKNPGHYTITVNGVEIDCWDVIRELGLWKEYGIASAMKYLWRCLRKGNTLKDLEKARAFLDKEISMRKANNE